MTAKHFNKDDIVAVTLDRQSPRDLWKIVSYEPKGSNGREYIITSYSGRYYGVYGAVDRHLEYPGPEEMI